jgi:hypothetical protein
LQLRASALLGAAICGIVLAPSSVAEARSRGIVSSSCDGCHGSSSKAELSLAPSPASFEPGARVTFTLGIRSPTIKVGGAYLGPNVGTLTPISGEGLVAATDSLIHDAPKPASGGQVTFRFEWQAPSTPGAVTFVVAALAANGDGGTSLDAPGYGEFQFVFGCEGREYFRDSDRDGYGTAELPTVLGCADSAPDQLAAIDGDCDDYNEALHPGATELCNTKDDNCDGQIDEGLDAAMLWPDADGDGYYASQSGTPKVGCTGLKGYAALPGDCSPSNAAVHPGAPELCNYSDDNCDGRVDERVRPQCGSGWCRRDSPTCSPEDCVPGVPTAETCNLLDDDCNGVIDDGAPCGAGMSCVSGGCQPGGAVGSMGGSTASSGGMSTAGVNAGGAVTSGGAMFGGSNGSSSLGGTAGCGASGCASPGGANASRGGVANGAATPGTHAGCGVAGGVRGASAWLSALALAVLFQRVRSSKRGRR